MMIMAPCTLLKTMRTNTTTMTLLEQLVWLFRVWNFKIEGKLVSKMMISFKYFLFQLIKFREFKGTQAKLIRPHEVEMNLSLS